VRDFTCPDCADQKCETHFSEGMIVYKCDFCCNAALIKDFGKDILYCEGHYEYQEKWPTSKFKHAKLCKDCCSRCLVFKNNPHSILESTEHYWYCYLCEHPNNKEKSESDCEHPDDKEESESD